MCVRTSRVILRTSRVILRTSGHPKMHVRFSRYYRRTRFVLSTFRFSQHSRTRRAARIHRAVIVDFGWLEPPLLRVQRLRTQPVPTRPQNLEDLVWRGGSQRRRMDAAARHVFERVSAQGQHAPQGGLGFARVFLSLAPHAGERGEIVHLFRRDRPATVHQLGSPKPFEPTKIRALRRLRDDHQRHRWTHHRRRDVFIPADASSRMSIPIGRRAKRRGSREGGRCGAGSVLGRVTLG